MQFKTWLNEMAQNSQASLESMGYDFRVENNLPQRLSIIVYYNNKWVCEASFTQDPNKIKEDNPRWADVWDDEQDNLKTNQMWVTNVWTDPLHQRKGLASSAYQLAQNVTGNQIIRTPSKTPDSDAMWQQPNRPF